jgi:rhodanese-related sulfurtransferase
LGQLYRFSDFNCANIKMRVYHDFLPQLVHIFAWRKQWLKIFQESPPEELENLRISGQPVELIDVRSPAGYRECYAAPARNVPLDSLNSHAIMESRNGSRETSLYIICQSGNRAQKACEKFDAIGHTSIVNVEGGTRAWQGAGLPVVQGKKILSLERQV